MDNQYTPRNIGKEELDFYLKETEVSSIHKALLQFSLPSINLKKLSRKEQIIKLILLKDLLIQKGFKVLPIFVLSNVVNSESIHKDEKNKSIEEILTEELSSPIKVVNYEFKETKDSGDTFQERHIEVLMYELKYFINAMNDSREITKEE